MSAEASPALRHDNFKKWFLGTFKTLLKQSFCSNSWKLTRQHKTTLGSNHLAGGICCQTHHISRPFYHAKTFTRRKGGVLVIWNLALWSSSDFEAHMSEKTRVVISQVDWGPWTTQKSLGPTASNSKVFLILLSTFFPSPVLETWNFPLRLALIQPIHQGCHRSLASSWAPMCKGPQTSSPSPPMKSFLLFFGRALCRKSRILGRGCAVDDQEGVHDVHDRCFWGHWGSSGSKST